jgi:hypothetical protein
VPRRLLVVATASVPAAALRESVRAHDPLKAIEDALRAFPADELIVVTLPDEDAGWLEEGSAEAALNRFSLPVTHLVVNS